MPTSVTDLQSQDAAFAQQASDQDAAEQSKQNAPAQEAPSKLEQMTNWVSGLPSRISGAVIDTAVSGADAIEHNPTVQKVLDDPNFQAFSRLGRDVVSGGMTAAVNTVDAARKFGSAAVANTVDTLTRSPAETLASDMGNPAPLNVPVSDTWEHAKAAILDFRDAVKVQDPNIVDSMTQFTAQVAPSFALASRALSTWQTLLKVGASGMAADATALDKDSPRTADMLSILRQTDGKIGQAMQAAGPYGLNAYINYLAHDGPESDAQVAWKNALDGILPNFIGTGVLHAAGVTVKAGYNAARNLADNGIGSLGDLFQMGPPAGSPGAQSGKVGYHGTPNDVQGDFFDDSKIGTGEGAQVYGYGHYVAENRETAEHYQNALTAGGPTNAALRLARTTLQKAGGDQVAAFKKLMDRAGADGIHANDSAHYMKAANLIKNGNASRGGGSLITVDLADEDIAKMVDHDKPMSDQQDILDRIPKRDQAQLQQTLDDHGQDLELGDLSGNEFRQLVERSINEGYLAHGDGSDAHAPRQAAQYLDSKGIRGIKYLDASSRRGGTGDGTRNYVVFDGKRVKITAKEK